jgi:putative transposase
MADQRRFFPPRNQRLAANVYCEAGCACFITVRADQRHSPFTRADLNGAVIDVLLTERLRSRCDVYAYCLMPDHAHVVAAPRADGDSVLLYVDRFKGTSTRVSWQFGAYGKLWQPRWYDHVIRSDEHLERVCEYILANPVRRGLVDVCQDYEWCGRMVPIPT